MHLDRNKNTDLTDVANTFINEDGKIEIKEDEKLKLLALKSKLKNITIFTGTNDILNPDVYVLKEKAEKSNIEINIKEYENAGHIWFIEKNSGEVLTNKGYQDCLETIKNQAE